MCSIYGIYIVTCIICYPFLDVTVLRENPGKDFAFIAKTMADRWKVADTETKEYYRGLSNEESRRYQEEIRLGKSSNVDALACLTHLCIQM